MTRPLSVEAVPVVRYGSALPGSSMTEAKSVSSYTVFLCQSIDDARGGLIRGLRSLREGYHVSTA